MSDNNKQPTSIVQQFEQAEGNAANLARLLGSYYEELVKNKVPKPLAYSLVRDFQDRLLRVTNE